MPQRQNIRTYPSDQVQGEGSYVKVRDRTWGQSKAFDQKTQDLDANARAQAIVQDITERITEWNWVDDDGEALPIPKNDPSVLDRLYDAEVRFLVEVWKGQAATSQDERKSSPS